MEDKILQVLRDMGKAMTHHEIAKEIQSNDQTVAPVLNKMEKDGVLEIKYSQLSNEEEHSTRYKIR